MGTEEKRGTTFTRNTDGIFETLGITKLDKEKNQCIREKTGAQNIVKENSTRKSGYNKYRGWTQIDYLNKHYNMNQRDEGT